MRNLYHSIRGNFRECKYYLRDENTQVGDLSVWVLKNTPQGEFYACEVQNINNQAQQINNTFMMDENNVTLKTEDNVNDLTRGCVVYYLGHGWIVDSVQRQLYKRESEFDTELQTTTYISIRR